MKPWTVVELTRAVYGQADAELSPWEHRMARALIGRVPLDVAVEAIYAGLDAEEYGMVRIGGAKDTKA